jgi:hypothetical protein
MSSNWAKTRLGDVLRIKHGFAFSGMGENSDPSLPIVVAIGNFDYAGGFRFGSTTIKRFSGTYPAEFRLAPGDVLLAMTCQTTGGEILGLPGTVPADGQTYLHNQRLGKVEVTAPERIHLPYVFQLARWSNFNRHLFATASGSKILHTAPSRIEDFELELPPRSEQERIADVLGSLDDLIESNRKVRGLAQELLRCMYARWFRDYLPWGGRAPESWQRGTLRQVLSLVKESTRPGVHHLPYVPIDTIPMNSLGLDGVRSNQDAQSSLQVFRQDDILVGAMRVYFHRVALAPFAGLTRNTTFVLRASDPAYLEYALLLCDQDSTIDFAQGASKGSTMPYAVWDGGLAEMPVLIPTRSDVELFSEAAHPLVEIVRDSFVKSTKLAELRDVLLPELLSGRLRVRDVEAAAA